MGKESQNQSLNQNTPDSFFNPEFLSCLELRESSSWKKDLKDEIYNWIKTLGRKDPNGNIPWKEEIDPGTGFFPIEEELRERILSSCSHLAKNEVDQIDISIALAVLAHGNQYRLTKLPFPSHPLEVGAELAEKGQDATTIISGILHDILEDTWVKKPLLELLFGKEVAETVDALSVYKGENVRGEIVKERARLKVALSILNNPRVCFIKIKDRKLNLRDIWAIPNPAKRVKTINESEDFYIPLAELTGQHEDAEPNERVLS